jgi:hypothetical protein
MGTVTVVVPFVLAQGVQQMPLVPDQRPVEQFVAAGLDPPFHDRVHARHPDAAEHDRDTDVGEDGVEQGRVLPVAITDELLDLASGVVEVHDEVAGRLGRPGGGRVGGGAEDANLACSMTVRTCRRAPVNVVVSMKSAARMAWAWERRNVA